MPDLTDYRNHGTVAKGGKVTVIQTQGDPWKAPGTVPNTVKNALMKIMYQSATDPDRPRVQGGAAAKSTEPLNNDRHHFVGMSILELSKKATALMAKHVSQHEVVHALFDLRNQQYIKFHTSKSQGNASSRGTDAGAGMGGSTPYGGIPVRIQMTQKGLDEGARLMQTRFTPETMTTPPEGTANGHGHTSDVEVEGGTPVVDETERIVALVPDPPKETPPIVVKVKKSLFGEGSLFTIAGYPEVLRASQAEQRIQEASRLLRLAGQDALADMALHELNGRSPLEVEVARLITQLQAEGVLSLEQEGGAEGE